MKKLSKKFVAGLLTIIIVSGTFLPIKLLPTPRAAEAQDAVVEVGANLKTNIVTTIKAASLELKEYVLDELVWVLINTTIQQLSASIVNWINSGFEGSPAFVQDLKGHFQDLDNQVFSSFVNEIGATDLLCSSFKARVQNTLQVQLAIQQGAGRFGKEAAFRRAASCTLDDVLANVGSTLEDFSQDFSKGGWPAWLTVIQPQNNVYGASLLVREELWRRQAETQTNRQQELGFGRGFLSWKKCTATGAPGWQETQGPPFLNDEGVLEYPGNPDVAGPSECIKEEIMTPGTAIEGQLNRALSFGESRLLVADEINEIISALFSQFFQKTIGSSGGLFGASRSSGSQSSYTNQLLLGEESFNQGKESLIERINDLVGTVEEVIALKEARLENVAAAETAIAQTIECSRRLGGSDIESQLADEIAELEIIKQDEQADIQKARADIVKLERYLVRIEAAQGATELEAVSTEFVRNFGDTDYDLELAILENDVDGVNERLNQIKAEANRLLSICYLQGGRF